MGTFIVGVPASILALQQQGLLERAFHDGLFPNLAYRAEAIAEEWPANTGTEIFMTRPGLLTPVTEPAQPGVDPIPQAVPYEQWGANLFPYNAAIDIDMPTSVTSNASTFLRSIHQLGLQAGQSINRVARNALFKSYLSGSTVTLTAILNTDTMIRVAALNGFRDVVNPGSNVRPAPVNITAALPITIISGATRVAANVVGVIPDDQTLPDGPGTLILAAAVGTAFAKRSAVKSAYAPRIVRASGGDSVDAVGPSDTFVLQQTINAVAFLRNASVQPHPDGFFHAHISPLSNAQVFADPVFQRLNQSLPEHVIYKEGFIGTLSGVMFFMNNESPGIANSGALVDTAATTGSPTTPGKFAREIGAEVVNGNGVQIGRVILTGKGSIYERRLDESQYATEAGTTGKIGEFDVINNGITIQTEGIRMILRAPTDRLQQKVGAAWSISTSFPIPSDITAPSGPEKFKRSICLEHAL